MSIHPDLHKWQVAKQAAFALASAMPGCTLLQAPTGKPRVIYGKLIRDFPSWLSAYSWLFQVRKDQLAVKEKEPDIPWGIPIE